MKILVINGPNINMLGTREPNVYGKQNYDALVKYIYDVGQELKITADCFQSNHEGEIVDAIQDALGKYQGIVINPAAYTHTSIAILDALKAVDLPAVEVHLSDVSRREPFRQISYAGMACIKTYMGLGFEGYRQAICFLASHINEKANPVKDS
ncbi:MAG: type II 3-dehydroquinate dehydratase [Clostridia bacterium]|nr:type II 3-dehydroquinate dehydratase [Clostridia bacterium]